MSFYKTKKSTEDLKQGGGTDHIVNSGCYPVNVIAPFVNVSKNGSTSVDLFLKHGEKQQVLYGNMRITNNDASENKIGSKIFNQLVIIADVEEVAEPEDAELPIGKKEAMEDVAVLSDLADLDVFVRVQLEYGAYNSNITEKKVIKGFYRQSDKASAEEIVNNENFGTQFEKDTPYFDSVTYKDGVTAETVAAWIAASRPKGTAGGTSAGGGASESAPKPSFGKKKSFGAKA